MKAIQEYMESPEVRGLAKATKDLYGYALQHFQKFLEDNTLNIPIKEKDLAAFAKRLEGKKLSGKSVQQYLTCTKIFLKWAGSPVEFIYKVSNESRQQNKRKHLDRWFSEDDIQRCLDYPFENSNGSQRLYRLTVRLLVETGARVGEIANIQRSDIHPEGNYILIHGKTEPRPVIYSAETARLIANVDKPFLTEDYKVFPDVATLKGAVTRMLDDLGMKAQGDGRGPHTFRHFTATYLFYEGNMRIEDLAFLLGDKVETIREKYLHPTPEMLRRRVNAAYGWS